MLTEQEFRYTYYYKNYRMDTLPVKEWLWFDLCQLACRYLRSLLQRLPIAVILHTK